MNKKYLLIILVIVTLCNKNIAAMNSWTTEINPTQIGKNATRDFLKHLTTFNSETLVGDGFMGLGAATPIALYGSMVLIAPEFISSIPIDNKTAYAAIFGIAPAAAEITGGPTGLLTYCTMLLLVVTCAHKALH